ncbi:hypothetical protein Vwe01_62010 [Micromonospora andamanensis]|nr:hypothetical protein Vwe01_62010 [Micromonospora andamanensis]
MGSMIEDPPNRAEGVTQHLTAIRNASSRARPPTAGPCGRTFFTSIKAALNGPHAPPPGRVSVAPLALRLRPRNTPGGWRGGREAEGAAAERTGR